MISGRNSENCEGARNALLALVPIADVLIPKEVHQMTEDYDVNISVSPEEQQSEGGGAPVVGAWPLAVADLLEPLLLDAAGVLHASAAGGWRQVFRGTQWGDWAGALRQAGQHPIFHLASDLDWRQLSGPGVR